MNHIGFWSVFKKDKVGWTIFPVGQNFRKRQYELNHIMFWSKVSINKTWVELYCLKLKIFLKGNMGWILLSFGQNFSKTLYALEKNWTISVEGYCCLVGTFLPDYMDWTVWCFGQNFPKKLYGLNCIFFSSQFFWKAIWSKLYCLLVKMF